MKVLIHALGASMGGAMRHLTNFLPQLAEQDSEREYIALVRESFPDLEATRNLQIERIPDEYASSWFRRTYGDIISLPRRIKLDNIDVLVSLTNFGPIWSPVPHILFQRNPLYYCGRYLSKIRGKEKLEVVVRRFLVVESMKRAALIVTPSNAMGEMIKRTCPQVEKRTFRTIYHGFARESLQEPLNSEFSDLLKQPGLKLLYPTHPAAHKGFEVLFEALSHLRKQREDFVLFATTSHSEWPEGHLEEQIKSLGLRDHISFIGRVPQRQMGALYQGCNLMVYPSLCESFGFSMIEAMGYGLPIVAAGTGVNREMCGDAALFYPPDDAKACASAIIEAAHPGAAARLVANGQDRVSSFDWGWGRYAREFIEMIDAVVSQN